MDETKLLVGRGLTKRYGGVTALADVSFELRAGEILGLVGPNGAGKTTLVDLISGAQAATAGELLLRGQRLTGPASRRARAGLGRTFQYPQLALHLSVRDNLLLGRHAQRHNTPWRMIAGAFTGVLRPERAADREGVRQLAHELGIEGLDREAGDLTLGEQRLVEVGRALGQNPVVLLLDEPFAGSDAQGVAGIADVIRTVQRRGHAVILVDHNVDLVARLVDRVLLLDRGRVAFDGDPAECLASPQMQEVYFGSTDADEDEDADAATAAVADDASAGADATAPSDGSVPRQGRVEDVRS
ncbi:branched-chain amino acid transport system ATP-binding protein [Micromonospora sp. M71_S20]|uniref:ABC transporter ATP-binding protein n=1 Tax=Micromonospora sp. M71_S20 TaxID=592872 RepID=UPI000EB3C79E|nr:ATP-binding cassette domain-containing protein [Micromonospora sp. M71_S20]RLK09747.1 branched-chain amino acid transport system ATP-binding protein [Micromonospora sp. M71_S20]